MKKRPILYIAIAVIASILIGVVFQTKDVQTPNAKLGTELWDALQAYIDAEHQSMKLDVSVVIAEDTVELSSNVYRTKVDDVEYLVFDQDDFPIYVVDNMLVLKNGKAFKIADEESKSNTEARNISAETDNLFQQMLHIYQNFKFSMKQIENEIHFEVKVTGEFVQSLLSEILPMEQDYLGDVKSLNLNLVLKEGSVERIELGSDSSIEDKEVKLNICLSAFQLMKAGEYQIPDAVIDSVKNTNRDTLFCLNKDLYPLLKASKSFESLKDRPGTVRIVIDFGLIQIDDTFPLAEIRRSTDKVENSTEVQKIPAWIGTLFLEGEISCVSEAKRYQYNLRLDTTTTKKISQILVPDLEKYRVTITKGEATLTIQEDEVKTIWIEMDGMVDVFIKEIPIGIQMEYSFE